MCVYDERVSRKNVGCCCRRCCYCGLLVIKRACDAVVGADIAVISVLHGQLF